MEETKVLLVARLQDDSERSRFDRFHGCWKQNEWHEAGSRFGYRRNLYAPLLR